VGSNFVSSNAIWKWFQRMPGQLMYPILVNLQKERKYSWPNGTHQKTFKKIILYAVNFV